MRFLVRKKSKILLFEKVTERRIGITPIFPLDLFAGKLALASPKGAKQVHNCPLSNS
jgi:hypothetical protein